MADPKDPRRYVAPRLCQPGPRKSNEPGARAALPEGQGVSWGRSGAPLPGLEGPHRLPLPLRLTFLGQVFVYDQLPVSQVVQHGPKVGGVSVD